MKSFPQELNIKNKDKFNKYFIRRLKCYLRKDIYEHMLNSQETDYYCISKFNHENGVKDKTITDSLLQDIILELEELGWNCKIGFGGTGLFIYSTDEPPNTFWG